MGIKARPSISREIYPSPIQDEKSEHSLRPDIFKENESRTLVNNTILDNGFLLIEELWQNWDGLNWVNRSKWTYTYDTNNNMIELLGQGWDGSNWMNIVKYTYTYDGNNNMIEWLYQDWDGSIWVNYRKWVYLYNVNNNMIEELEQDLDGSYWANNEKYTYTYITIIEQGLDYELFQNYPNPFNAATTIRYELPQDGVVTLKIYDILGQEVASILNEFKKADRYEVNFNAIGLSSGVYFYKLQSGSFVETKKMVILK